MDISKKQTKKTVKKKAYKKPSVKQEEVGTAGLQGQTCNGMAGGAKKTGGGDGCTILLS